LWRPLSKARNLKFSPAFLILNMFLKETLKVECASACVFYNP